MKNFMIYFILIFSSSLYADESPIDDRHNPFQFKYPEYQFKAETVQVHSIDQLPDHYKTIKFYGYEFFVPETFVLQNDEGMSSLAVRDKNNKGKFLISRLPSNSLLCSDARKKHEKDYCSAFVNRRDILYKSFTLTPDDLIKKYDYVSKGYWWIVFNKGIYFEYVSDIKIYKKNNFVFFREDLKKDNPIKNYKTSIMISSPINDELLDIAFFEKDEKLIMDFIKSFQLAK